MVAPAPFYVGLFLCLCMCLCVCVRRTFHFTHLLFTRVEREAEQMAGERILWLYQNRCLSSACARSSMELNATCCCWKYIYIFLSQPLLPARVLLLLHFDAAVLLFGIRFFFVISFNFFLFLFSYFPVTLFPFHRFASSSCYYLYFSKI